MERRFCSLEEAERFLGAELDREEQAREQEIGPGLTLQTRAVGLADGTFCNRHTARWRAPARTRLCVVEPLESPFARARQLADRGERGLVATGGFFFLADDAAALPRARSLNLAEQGGRVLGLPVGGQDALVGRAGVVSVSEVAAEGTLLLNGAVVRWAGRTTCRSGAASKATKATSNTNSRSTRCSAPSDRTSLKAQQAERTLAAPLASSSGQQSTALPKLSTLCPASKQVMREMPVTLVASSSNAAASTDTQRWR